MATSEQVSLVRAYTGEPTEETWTDVALGALIDELGADSTTARVWREKQARYSKLVDVSEAGASRKMSQAFDHAKTMTAYWATVAGEDVAITARATRVHKIVRT